MTLIFSGKEVSETEEVLITVLTCFDLNSHIKGYHVYKGIWTPDLNEKLSSEVEPDNIIDKYAVAVKKEGKVVGHLPLGKNGKFAKMIFYFLKADHYGKCDVTVTGRAVNLGDDDGMQVPCTLHFSAQKEMIQMLKKKIL